MKKEKESPLIKRFAESVTQGAYESRKHRYPGFEVREELFKASTGESIIRILSRYDSLGDSELEKKVKEMAGELFNIDFYRTILRKYITNGIIHYDREKNFYSIR